MVAIIRHGLLKPLNHYYFIDIELGVFTLEYYLASYFDPANRVIDWASLQGCEPAVVQRECSPILRLENWCMIGSHVASGVRFMHSNNFLHRDLKPANGTQTRCRNLISSA